APPDLLNPRAHRIHYDPRVAALVRQAKLWPTSPRLLLPNVPDRLPVAPRPRVALGLVPISLIAQRCAGLRNFDAGRRWAPTGGTLGSVLLSWAVPGGAEWRGGVSAYEAEAHALAVIGDSETFAELHDAVDPPAGRLAHLVFTADLARV